MTTSTPDWELLNAYSDGELSAPDAAALERRLLAEPCLAQTLEQIQSVGLALKTLRPAAPDQVTPAKPARRSYRPFYRPLYRPLYRPVAIAASIALVIFFTGQRYLSPPQPLSPTDLHQAFLQQPFDVKTNFINVKTTSPDAPDLSGANLTLVGDRRITQSTRAARATRALHYAGRNGCRLTLAITTGNAPVVRAEANLLLASWNVSSVYYTLLSTGMDTNKFAAITQYVRIFSEKKQRPAILVAMRTATKKAVPCNDTKNRT